MTIRDVIRKVMELKPSQYGEEILLGWLSALDGQIWDDVLRHYRAEASAPAAYTEADMDRELLVPWPHEDVYVTYLSAMIDYQNGEWERYNNTMMMHNAQLQAFYNAVNRREGARQDAYIRI